MNFHQSFKKCSILTPDIRTQPHTSLESFKLYIKVKLNMASRGSYVYNSMVGGHPKMLVLCNFLRKIMVSDKKIHRTYITHTNLY